MKRQYSKPQISVKSFCDGIETGEGETPAANPSAVANGFTAAQKTLGIMGTDIGGGSTVATVRLRSIMQFQ